MISTFEYGSVVAAWRYYAGGGSIQSVSYIGDVVEHFWGNDSWKDRVKTRSLTMKPKENPYTEADRVRIAGQFVEVDFRDECSRERFKKEWQVAYEFFKAYLNQDFKTIELKNAKQKLHETVDCFKFGDEWIPWKMYVKNTEAYPHCEPKYIVSIDGKKVKKTSRGGTRESGQKGRTK